MKKTETANLSFTTAEATVSQTQAPDSAASSTMEAIFAINEGADYTNSQQVTLNLSAVKGEGIIEMSVDDNISWESLNLAKAYTLSAGDGLKSVDLYLKDASGTIMLTDTITLDTVVSSPTFISATSTYPYSVVFSWSAAENTTGRIDYGLTSAYGSYYQVSQSAASHTATISGLIASTTYYYQIIASDSAANQAFVASGSLTTSQVGRVKTFQKISDTAGNFTAVLDNEDTFGVSSANIGDLNGDGIEDLAVDALVDDDGGTNRGAVYILFLNTNGTVKSHQKISDTAGNFGAILNNEDRIGMDLANIGDLNGDGVTDLAVGVSRDDDGGTDRGAVYILFLNTNGTVNSYQKISDTAGNFSALLENEDHFGRCITAIGDVNGDGVMDIAVGAYWDDDGGYNRGAVYILFLNANGSVSGYQKISDTAGNFTAVLDNEDYFGIGATDIGDLNHDGIPDLAISSKNDDGGGTDRGAVYILFLNTDGTVKSHQKISNTLGNFSALLDNGDFFGGGMAFLGDYNGDGINDLVACSSQDDDGGTNRGAIYILFLK
ncbi:hypothetical protein ACFL35_21765 [Candidatus Riflebacteria bacterium]